MKDPASGYNLTVPERNLLHAHYAFYKSLDDTTRTPTTVRQKHFVAVCRGEADAENEHERAYQKLKGLLAAGTIRESDIEKFRYGVHAKDSRSLRGGVLINPIVNAEMPLPGETCAICLPDQLKRAALLFDRVFVNAHCFESQGIPRELAFFCDRYEWYAIEWALQSVEDETMESRRIHWSALNEDEHDALLNEILEDPVLTRRREEYYLGYLVDLFATRAGLRVTPVLSKDEQITGLFGVGHHRAYTAAIANLPIVLEGSVSWEQVTHFREDPASVAKYRKLRLWLESGLTADSVAQAEDIISQKIDDYSWAIRKHGLETTTGAISYLLDSRNLLAAAAAAGIAAAVGRPAWEVLLGGGLVFGAKTCVWVAERMIEREDITRGQDSEVAVLYEANELARKHGVQ